MRKIKMLGLALATMFALSVVVVGSASASPEWLPSTSKATFTGTSTLSLLSSGNHEIECTSVKITKGLISGPKTVSGVLIEFINCKDVFFGAACESTSPASGKSGTVDVNPLKGELIYLKSGAKTPAGILLKPETGTKFTTISCVGEISKESVTGSLIGEVTPINKMETKGSMIFNRTGLEQQWFKIEEAGTIFDLLAFGEAAAEESTESLTFSEAVGIKA